MYNVCNRRCVTVVWCNCWIWISASRMFVVKSSLISTNSSTSVSLGFVLTLSNTCGLVILNPSMMRSITSAPLPASSQISDRLSLMRQVTMHSRFYATADEADAYMFYRFFLFFLFFFSVRQKIWDNRSRERLNGFSWNFYQTIPRKMEFATSCRRWRMANVDNLRNLRYDSGAITRGRHARRLRYKIMSARMDLI